jgi:hypothetical protein
MPPAYNHLSPVIVSTHPLTVDLNLVECYECGAVVRDMLRHTEWHKEVVTEDHVDEPTTGVPR